MLRKRNKVNWKRLKGKRILIEDIFSIEEVIVDEVSPSGKYAKLINLKDNSIMWVESRKILEVLR